MLIRAILPEWAAQENPSLRRAQEGYYEKTQIDALNEQGYNIYFFPNYPSNPDPNKIIDGTQIDTFQWVFVDMDLKENKYPSKEAFLEVLTKFPLTPTLIVDSGNGVHAYWNVTDLDGMTFLRLQRRLIRYFNTDEAIAKILQLMRVPGTWNTKQKDNFKLCEIIQETPTQVSSEDLDKHLPIISSADEAYCKQHYDKTYKLAQDVVVDHKLPTKFAQLIKNNAEVKDIWTGGHEDRSKADYRLGHIMWASDFTKEEAMSVLVNSAKAMTRSATHQISYAQGIIDKIWTYESSNKNELSLSQTVKEILDAHGSEIKGTRFPCWSYIDNTEHGFRLGQVIGLVAGVGVGKTAYALNMFKGFVQNNPDYDHFFIPLEQPSKEIADRWKTMCGTNQALYNKVHIISNYDANGAFRNLSLTEIKDYLLKFQEVTKRKIGAVVIDHIGVLKKKGKSGENQDLMDICHAMKAFAVETNTMLIMQSQSPREKAGIGDLELNKDAAYGTVYFEAYCDYLITLWQPLKRCYSNKACPTVTAFKFCKIRHKKQGIDKILEDVCYTLLFDPATEHLRELTEKEEKGFLFWLNDATNKRKLDRKTDLVTYKSVRKEDAVDGNTDNSKNNSGITKTSRLPS